MKKILYILSLIMCVLFTSCTAWWKEPLPESGTWFCEELNMYIDFDLMTKQENGFDCVKKYNPDNNEYVAWSLSTDFGGNKIYFRRKDDAGEMLLNGYYSYKDGKLAINPFFEDGKLIETEKEYIFLEVDEDKIK